MNEYITLEPWWRFFVAIMIGALIGLEREFIQQKEDSPDFAGIRTFALIALLGAVTTFIEPEFGLLPFSLAFGAIILLALTSFIGKQIRKESEEGITTEVAVVLVFILGAIVFLNQVVVAGVIAVLVALMLSLKKGLHGAIRRMKRKDLRVTLQFALVSVVILPILPNQTIDPIGIINPFRIWLLVVFISGIGFIGYMLMKLLGADTGTLLTGLLGGIVSSTATTLSFTSRSKETPDLSPQFAQAILLASAMMALRVLVVVGVLFPRMLKVIGIPLGVMLISGLLITYLFWKQQKPEKPIEKKAIKVANPLKLSTAILFGLVFAIVLIIINFANNYLGTFGVYLTSLITGLTDVNPVMLSATELASKNLLTMQVAGISIVLASLTNTLSKCIIASYSGSPKLRPLVLPRFGIILALGIISLVLVILLNYSESVGLFTVYINNI